MNEKKSVDKKLFYFLEELNKSYASFFGDAVTKLFSSGFLKEEKEVVKNEKKFSIS